MSNQLEDNIAADADGGGGGDDDAYCGDAYGGLVSVSLLLPCARFNVCVQRFPYLNSFHFINE